ncbi:bifunctional riboflavin kinase/FAD synthetase [Belliella kenyensis]|uniref:Riboflavin biosynthesis protein n=1 Tax=Belliella kenyensis TaxID=1472724 RepID=A0ABV8EHN9_9BACT|nr:bifunctional riboflavin kinase/FAD synthetase [Belliella kenyensis]MCH7401739.1 bifunctional riboflavin kinase/FAD synthetase [Belliella kenyensis]MDN3604239.1 bifunctional riboflavin kinase/FAD synthetase [Belliella kenyensis]
MRIFEGINNFVSVNNPVVTSGTFDGVHLGHQKILKRIRNIADDIGGETVLITFWPHPRLVLYPKEHNLLLLSTFEEKAKFLQEAGVDHLLTIPFTKEFSQLSSDEFIQKIIIDTIQTRKLVIGYDHRFGKNREGSFEFLKSNIAQYPFELEEISRQDVDDVGVSSTKIRAALWEGKVQVANEYLGRPYELNGIIIKGQQLGRSIGFPTANVHVPNDYKLIPCDGAYAVRVIVEGNTFDGMLNIGHRPTVNGSSRSIEVNLFNFDGNLYDKRVCVKLMSYLRAEVKFESLQALKSQLNRDKSQAMEILTHI